MHSKSLALDWYREQKLKDVCNRCGIGHQAVIEYHHIDPKTKRDSISNMVHNGLDITIIKEEFAKCIPLCKNCHAIFHWDDKHGKTVRFGTQMRLDGYGPQI